MAAGVEEQLILTSELAELARVHDWLVGLSEQHGISADTVWAMDLCLEEAASNVIRHGYAGAPGQPVTIRFEATPAATPHVTQDGAEGGAPRDQFVLIVEDKAPPFNPLLVPEPEETTNLEEVRIGGRGVQLMRKFSNSLEYEQLPSGNRLRIGFLPEAPKLAVD